jgi:hypothetical protein
VPADVITTDVPSFSAIAKRSGMTLEAIAGQNNSSTSCYAGCAPHSR